MNYWIVKSEPSAYSWAQFVEEGQTAWTGVRNFAARNHLRAMKRGDLVFFYHSGEEKQVVGLARAAGASAADVVAGRGKDFEVKVADGQIVTLSQAVSKGLGLRVFVDGRTVASVAATCSTAPWPRSTCRRCTSAATTSASWRCRFPIFPSTLNAMP